jgi:hypothetical protein
MPFFIGPGENGKIVPMANPQERLNPPGWAVEVEDLVKTFGKFTAVDRIHLTVGKGEIFGFLPFLRPRESRRV